MTDDPGYRAVVFDLDGTLVDTLPDLHEALVRALADEGLPAVPPRVVRASLHGGLETSAAAALAWLRVLPDGHGGLIDAYRRHYDAIAGASSRVYDGVVEMLTALRGAGTALAVCTNKTSGAAAELLCGLGLMDFFNAVVGGDTCARRKPDPMPLRWAIRRLGLSAESVLFVGDSIVDYQCARAAGVAFKLYRGGYGAEEVLRHRGVDVIESYRRLPAGMFPCR